MAKVKASGSSGGHERIRKALTTEAREMQLTSLAVDLAEKQLLEGTASSQLITHYLKVGSSREQLELERLRAENEMLIAKTKALAAAEDQKVLLENALKAFTEYSAEARDDDDYDDYQNLLRTLYVKHF